MLTIQKSDNEIVERLNGAYQREGWRGVLKERIKIAEADPNRMYFQIACMHSKLGNKDKAIEYLEKAYQERRFQIAILEVEPQLDPLRKEPQFVGLIQRVFKK